MRGTIDAIYWRLHFFYLKNERKKAELFLSMLESEKPEDIINEIGEVHYRRFQQIKNNIIFGNFRRLYGTGTSMPAINEYFVKEPDIKEKEFHKLLMTKSGRLPLFSCLGASEASTMVHEIEVSPYGRIDFVVKDGRKWYAVEVKVEEAKDDIIGQVDKYFVALELEMNLGLHDYVGAAVVAPSFSPYVTAELSRMGVIMVTHSGTAESLSKIGEKELF
jgi:hypothetical protein